MNSNSDPSQPENGGGEAAGNGGAQPASGEQAPSELDALRAERDKFREQLLRVAADFENFRKRSKRDLDDARVRAKHDVIADLLPIFDNLELATRTAGNASDLSSVVEGVKMVLKLFEDTAERLGLLRVPSVGERFDPAVHEAIQQKETSEHAPGTVITEISAGYRFGERLVRPARVVVARKPKEASEAAPPAAPPAAASASTPAQASASVRPSKAPEANTEAKPDDATNGEANRGS